MPADIKTLRAWYQSTLEHPGARAARKNYFLGHAFYDGDQLTESEKRALEERGQPVIQVNKIFAKMNNLMGAQRFNRTRPGVIPVTLKDEKVAEALSDLLRHIAYRSGAAQEESEMFDSGVLGGIGWIEVIVKDTDMGNKEIITKSERAELIRKDPYSREYDLSDSKFVCRTKWMDFDEAKNLFPKKTKELESSMLSAESEDVINAPGEESIAVRGPMDDYDLKAGSYVGYVDPKRRRIRLVEMEYREYTTLRYKLSPGGGLVWVDNLDAFRRLDLEDEFGEPLPDTRSDSDIMEAEGIQERRQKVVRKAIYSGMVKLEDNRTVFDHPSTINRFTFIPFTCFRKKKSGEEYGFVAPMMDPQRERNKRRSKALHILNSSKIIMDEGAVEDEEELREEAARPDSIIKKRPGSELSIETDTNLAASQFNIMAQSDQDIDDSVGIFADAVGKSSNARTGIAIQSRKSYSNQNTIKVFDNLRRTRLLLYKFELGAIKKFYTEEQILNVVDNDGKAKAIKLNVKNPDGTIENDVKQAMVDVRVEEMQPSANANEEQFATLAELAKAGIVFPPEVYIKASSLRDKEELIALISKQQPAPQTESGQNPPNQRAQQ